MTTSIVIYFSRKGENYCAGTIRKLEKGNTQLAAELIAGVTGADLFELETVEPYPENYSACTDQAKRELAEDARPELKALPNIDAYDQVFVAYPNWWGTIPMPVATALEALDLAGKRVRPLCTNEGSGMGSSERDIKRLVPNAKVERGIAVTGHLVAESRGRISAWAREA